MDNRVHLVDSLMDSQVTCELEVLPQVEAPGGGSVVLLLSHWFVRVF